MERNTSAEHSLVGRRVLVVEDESMVTMLLEDTLADIGCEVIGLASRFNDALEKAKTLSFDVAVLDVNLNGRETFRLPRPWRSAAWPSYLPRATAR